MGLDPVASRDQALPDAELKQLLGYDLEGAKRLLQQAGVTSLDFEVQVGDYLGGLVVNASELVKAQLAKAGLNAKLSVKDGTAWLNAVRVTGEFTCAFGIQSAIEPTSAELLTRHYSKGFQNTTGVSDPDLDKMIDQQAALVKDAAARAKLIQDIQRRVHRPLRLPAAAHPGRDLRVLALPQGLEPEPGQRQRQRRPQPRVAG